GRALGRFLAFGLLLPAEEPAETFLLRRRCRRGCGLLGLGVRIELAADQLDLRDFGAVAAAEAQTEDPRVAARPRLEPRRQRVEQLGDDGAILDLAEDETARVQRA